MEQEKIEPHNPGCYARKTRADIEMTAHDAADYRPMMSEARDFVTNRFVKKWGGRCVEVFGQVRGMVRAAQYLACSSTFDQHGPRDACGRRENQKNFGNSRSFRDRIEVE
jgi:hypothetical protein